MSNSWFDLQAFIDCSKEKGEKIEICRSEIRRSLDAAYGIPEEKIWSCKPLNGYSLIEKMSSVAINHGTTIIKDSREVVYVFAEGFNSSEVDENTYFKVNGRLNQVSLIQTIIHRGITIVYKYQVKETSLTID